MSDVEKIELEKINFINEYGEYIESNILNKINENDNIMILVLAILMSNKKLKDCNDYIELINYIDEQKVVPFKKNNSLVKNILNTIRGFSNKIYHNDTKGQIIDIKLAHYNSFIDTLEEEKQYIKQA